MVACLRSSRFMLGHDRTNPVHLDLRRLHNLKAENDNKAFVVTKRFWMPETGRITSSKHFDTLAEARRYWCEQAVMLEDQGMQRMDWHISGFHEED